MDGSESSPYWTVFLQNVELITRVWGVFTSIGNYSSKQTHLYNCSPIFFDLTTELWMRNDPVLPFLFVWEKKVTTIYTRNVISLILGITPTWAFFFHAGSFFFLLRPVVLKIDMKASKNLP